MNEKKKNTLLTNRYFAAKNDNIKPYFDVSEIEELMSYFVSLGDFDNYGEIIVLGIKLHPGEGNLKIQAFEYYMHLKQYKKAIGFIEPFDFDEEKYSISKIFFLLEGYCYLKDFETVDTLVDKLIFEKEEDIEDIYDYICDVINLAELYNESFIFVQKGLERQPNHLALKEINCNYLDVNERYEEAIVLCNELIDSEPYSFEYWHMLARIYLHQLKYEEAIDACDYALISIENEPSILLQKAYCYAMLECYEESLNLYLKIYKLENEDHTVKPYIAECYVKLERYDQGYTWLQDYIYDESIKKEPLVYLTYMECCAELDKHTEEEAIFNKLSELYPENIILLYLKALQSTKKGDDETSIELLEQVLLKFSTFDIKPNIMMECYFKMGALFFDVKEYQKGYKYFLKTKKIKNNYPELNLKLAECCLYLNRFKELMIYAKRLKVKEKKIFLKKYIINSTFTAAEDEQLLKILEQINKKKNE